MQSLPIVLARAAGQTRPSIASLARTGSAAETLHEQHQVAILIPSSGIATFMTPPDGSHSLGAQRSHCLLGAQRLDAARM